MDGFGFGGGLWMILIRLISLVLIILGIRYFGTQTGSGRLEESALELLN